MHQWETVMKVDGCWSGKSTSVRQLEIPRIRPWGPPCFCTAPEPGTSHSQLTLKRTRGKLIRGKHPQEVLLSITSTGYCIKYKRIQHKWLIFLLYAFKAAPSGRQRYCSRKLSLLNTKSCWRTNKIFMWDSKSENKGGNKMWAHWPPPCMASVSRLYRCTGLQNPCWQDKQ